MFQQGALIWKLIGCGIHYQLRAVAVILFIDDAFRAANKQQLEKQTCSVSNPHEY